MPAQKSLSWINFVQLMQRQRYLPEDLQTEGLEHILNINQITHNVFNYSIPWIYVLDYTSGKYLLISKSMKPMLGYDHQYFMDGGLDLVFDNYEKKHFRLFNEEIFPDRLKILSGIPPVEHPNYVFSYNFQYRNKKGEMINLLQRNCFVKSDEQGNPLLSFGVISNVNHYLSVNPVIQVVEKIGEDGVLDEVNTIFKKSYYLNKEQQLFTKRELELLRWMSEGLSSKELADKLFISEHTIIAHKRNMMQKLNASNITELVSFALKNQLL
jgi:DNA-binding CsgD family transcriptional regulator